ncbi:hypothetical protein IGI04_006106 [Brassica rapa subsp. trilocularis]|uniref:Uncharacterized protein n=1 Tax=Brassica rapa subsp. trilocularis TaxID=1813537 RepID=A0ABQ7NFW2_BRACM|nr:hypothetical protein IGI04_006106 [Brassica rapa subsp. trilocularis]
MMFGLQRKSNKEKPQRNSNSQTPFKYPLNYFDEFVSVQEQPAVRRKTTRDVADPKRQPFQIDVQQICDNLVKGVDKALKDFSKSQKKSTSTRAPVAEPSLFISKKAQGESENHFEELKDFSDSLPIFDESDEELIESLMFCEKDCDLPSLETEFNLDNEQAIVELTVLQPELPSSLVLSPQVFEEEPLDFPHQCPCLDTRICLDDDLGPIFDEEDEPGPVFDEEATSITSIAMENYLCFDPGTTPAPLPPDLQEHCEEPSSLNSLPDMFVKVSTDDVIRFGLDKMKDFFVSKSVFDNMINSLKIFEPDKCLDQSRFQNVNGITSGIILSFDQFLEHNKGFHLLGRPFDLDLQQTDFCAEKSLDSFVCKGNSFDLSSSRHVLITDELFASSYALDEILIQKLLEQKSLETENDFRDLEFCGSVLQPDLLSFETDNTWHFLRSFRDNGVVLSSDDILVYNTFFEKCLELLINDSQTELKLVCSDVGKDMPILKMNTVVAYLDKILVCNIYFDEHLERLKNVQFVLGKDILICDLNKYLSCTFDPGLLVFVLSIQERQVQPLNESIGRAQQPQIWRSFVVQTGYLGASDRGSVQEGYLNSPKVFCLESNFTRKPTHQGFTEAWNRMKSFTDEEVMNFPNRRFFSPSICEYQISKGDSCPRKNRPEPKPILHEPKVFPQSFSCLNQKHCKDHELIASTLHENISPTEVQPFSRSRSTDRAVYRIDPRAPGRDLRMDPRPVDQISQTTGVLPRPIRHSRANSQARTHDHREESDSGLSLSFLARLGRTARPDQADHDLSNHFDDFMMIDASNYSKGRILKLSEDLGRAISSSVHGSSTINHAGSLTFMMFGLQRKSNKEKPQRNSNSQTPFKYPLNYFDEFVSVQEQPAIRRKTTRDVADPKRQPFQIDVQQICDNLVKGVDKALKDFSKSQKKSTSTRAPVAEPSLFISKKAQGESENHFEELKDFSDSLPIFDESDEELIESLMFCEKDCDLPSLETEFNLDNEQAIVELTVLQPELPSSLVLSPQVFEKEPLDFPHQCPCLDTRICLDDDLGPIFDEEDEPGQSLMKKQQASHPLLWRIIYALIPAQLLPLYLRIFKSTVRNLLLLILCLTYVGKDMPILKMNTVVAYLDKILVCNIYFDEHLERLKNVQFVLGKDILICDLNKYLSCTFDPGLLVFVLSIQERQVQPLNESIGRAQQPQIWRSFVVQTGYLGASDRGSVQEGYLNSPKVFCLESNFTRKPTNQGFTEAWNRMKSFTDEEVMNFPNRRFFSPFICEYQISKRDSCPRKNRPEPKPILHEPKVFPQSFSCLNQKHCKDHELIASTLHENVLKPRISKRKYILTWLKNVLLKPFHELISLSCALKEIWCRKKHELKFLRPKHSFDFVHDDNVSNLALSLSFHNSFSPWPDFEIDKSIFGNQLTCLMLAHVLDDYPKCLDHVFGVLRIEKPFDYSFTRFDVPFSRSRSTDRAVYRIDPRAPERDLRMDPRPDDQISQTTCVLPRPIRHSRANSQARTHDHREESDSGLSLSFLARLGRTARPDQADHDLSNHFDDFMMIDASNYSKGRILKLSEDLGRAISSSVHGSSTINHAGSLTSVLLLTANDLITRG